MGFRDLRLGLAGYRPLQLIQMLASPQRKPSNWASQKKVPCHPKIIKGV